MILAHVLCCARVLWPEMVKRGELPEPTTAAHLARLKPRKRSGGKMSDKDLADPAKAKYIGLCCGGTRVWGEGEAAVYMDECAYSRWPRTLDLLPSSFCLPLLSRRSLLFFPSVRRRNDFAVYVCGGCKEPLPLASKATHTSVLQQAIERRAAFDKAVHHRADTVVDYDFAQNYVMSPHQSHATKQWISPSAFIVRPGVLPLPPSSQTVVGSKRARSIV